MKPPIRQRKPNRMPGYNYSARGCYFVTICVQNEESLGRINEGKITLSPTGETVKKCWLEIPDHFTWIRLDEFIIMPDHMHGILVILQNPMNASLRSQPSRITINTDTSTNCGNKPLDRTKMELSKIIQCFKSSVTREINKNSSSAYFAWQKSFYDHIIRSYKELTTVRRYIKENPNNWPKICNDFNDVVFK
jgi:putative transposase